MSLFQKMSAQKMTKKLVSICKRCYSIRLFEVSLDFCIEDEKEKIKSNTSNWSMPALNTGKWQVVTHTFTVFTSMASGVTWSGGSGGVVNHQFNFNYSITPLVCPDCPQGECDICFLEPGGVAGLMEKCESCEHRFLCATNRLEAQKWGI